MLLELAAEQRDFAASVRDALSASFPPDRVRDESGSALLPDQLRLLGELGLLGALLPDRIPGGLGMGLLDVVAAVESVGYATPSGPWPEVLALGAMLGRTPDERAEPIAARVASGEALVSGDLSGSCLVPHAGDAAALVMRRDGRLFLLEPSQWSATAQPGFGGHVDLDHVAWDPAADPLDVDAGLAEWTAEAAGVVIAALSCGIAARLVEMTTEYALQRRQFGVPIGSFQAVKHQLVDAYTAVEVARPGVWAAAWSVDNRSDDARWRSSAVRVSADAAVTTAARVALQVHGAIGYTDELPLAAWLKSGWCVGLRWGTVRQHITRMTGTLFEAGPRSRTVGGREIHGNHR